MVIIDDTYTCSGSGLHPEVYARANPRIPQSLVGGSGCSASRRPHLVRQDLWNRCIGVRRYALRTGIVHARVRANARLRMDVLRGCYVTDRRMDPLDRDKSGVETTPSSGATYDDVIGGTRCITFH